MKLKVNCYRKNEKNWTIRERVSLGCWVVSPQRQKQLSLMPYSCINPLKVHIYFSHTHTHTKNKKKLDMIKIDLKNRKVIFPKWSIL